MGTLASGLLAVISGITAVVAASLSLAAGGRMSVMPPTARPDPVPAYLLLSLGILILVNGGLLVLRVEIPMRPQGVTMVVYGILMILVGTTMAFTSLFAMDMNMLSAIAMYVLGGLMIALGTLMVTRPSMTTPIEAA
ncbi:MAG: hypothetical protein ACE5HJ_06865 [Thermoplasmata archaeon]